MEVNKMTERQLIAELENLKKSINAGDATEQDAYRLVEIQKAIRFIRRARDGTVWGQ